MSIHILPTQLANQIAAGEVVERPASVVKELVENSIDAQAHHIEVTIERGGHKQIQVRDDGVGVSEDELTLALSRHATSKLANQDDLEHIMTLGFRGEALASISSVSRLTLTSRPKSQENAWQAQAHGRDMAVDVTPAAHPIGTTVQVVDLFFNTPARRKFLRSEKTEFNHIDELLKRLALSHYEVSFKLIHNGKLLRHYRSGTTFEHYSKRVATVMGKPFIEQACSLDNQHQNMRLWGWLGSPDSAQTSHNLQYFYVNGRIVRDKLILHAIRQSFSTFVDESQISPAFVLYLELPADQVDVNVHPTKHEVRFHQARLIHDYIQRILTDVLQTHTDPSHMQVHEAPYHEYTSAGAEDESSLAKTQQSDPATSSSYQPRALNFNRASMPSQGQIKAQQQLMQSSRAGSVNGEDDLAPAGASLRPLQLIAQRYLLLGDQTRRLTLMDLATTWQETATIQFIDQWDPQLVSAPLLLPQKVSLSKEQYAWAQAHRELLTQLGFQVRADHGRLTVLSTPTSLRRAALQSLIEMLVDKLMALADVQLVEAKCCCTILAEMGAINLQFNWSAALGLYQQALAETGQISEEFLIDIDEQQLLRATL